MPPPVVQQIIKKPHNRPEKPKVKLFSIWTPVEKLEKEEDGEGDGEDDKKGDTKGKGAKKDTKGGKKDDQKEGEGEGDVVKGPLLDDSITRWILQPGEAKPLHIKFFSTIVGKFNQILSFEVCGSSKQFPLDIKAI